MRRCGFDETAAEGEGATFADAFEVEEREVEGGGAVLRADEEEEEEELVVCGCASSLICAEVPGSIFNGGATGAAEVWSGSI